MRFEIAKDIAGLSYRWHKDPATCANGTFIGDSPLLHNRGTDGRTVLRSPHETRRRLDLSCCHSEKSCSCGVAFVACFRAILVKIVQPPFSRGETSQISKWGYFQ